MLGLFAEEVVSSGGNSSGVWVVLGTIVGTVSGYFFGWLKDRDKLRFDSKMKELETKVAACEEKHAVCNDTTDELKREADKLKLEVAELRRRDDEDRRELEAKITSIQAVSQPPSKHD